MSRILGDRRNSHASATCIGLTSRRCAISDNWVEWREAAERKERHVRYLIAVERVDQLIVVPLNEIVEILDADDIADAATFSHLRRGNMAQSDMADQPLPLQIGKDGKRFFD
jgi:hypothetical protein